MVYYRSDLLKRDGPPKPPATWLTTMIAQRYQGKDLNSDGKADYGSCIAKKRAAQLDVVVGGGSYLQAEGTSQAPSSTSTP